MSQLLSKALEFVEEKVEEVPKPEATLESVELKQVSIENVEFEATVCVNNPYILPLPISQISYTFKSAGSVIASGTTADPGSLKGNGKTTLTVPMKVEYSIMVSLAKDVGVDGDIDYEVEIGLTIHLPVIGNITITLTMKGEITLPTLSDTI